MKTDKTVVKSNLIHLEKIMNDAFNELGDYGNVSVDTSEEMLKQFDVMKKILGKKS